MQQRVDPTYLYDQISFKFLKFETILNKTFRKTKSSLPREKETFRSLNSKTFFKK